MYLFGNEDSYISVFDIFKFIIVALAISAFLFRKLIFPQDVLFKNLLFKINAIAIVFYYLILSFQVLIPLINDGQYIIIGIWYSLVAIVIIYLIHKLLKLTNNYSIYKNSKNTAYLYLVFYFLSCLGLDQLLLSHITDGTDILGLSFIPLTFYSSIIIFLFNIIITEIISYTISLYKNK